MNPVTFMVLYNSSGNQYEVIAEAEDLESAVTALSDVLKTRPEIEPSIIFVKKLQMQKKVSYSVVDDNIIQNIELEK